VLRWARRTRSLDALLLVLYLRGVSIGDFQEALVALVTGGGVVGLGGGIARASWSGWLETVRETTEQHRLRAGGGEGDTARLAVSITRPASLSRCSRRVANSAPTGSRGLGMRSCRVVSSSQYSRKGYRFYCGAATGCGWHAARETGRRG
jgi:hypothetical protein